MKVENLKLVNTPKELPNNIEAEQIILGSILVNNEIFDEISNIINENIFFDPIHQKIFSYISTLISKGLLATPITLKNYLENDQSLKEIGGSDYIAKLTRLSGSILQAKDFAKLIYDLHLRRKLIELSGETLSEANNKNLETSAEQLIEKTEKKLFDLAERGKFDRSYISFQNALIETVEMAQKAFKNDEGIVGVPTGLKDLDERLGGLHSSDLLIIAGRPSMGKTALATNIAFHAAKNILEKKGGKSSVAFFSLEMSSEQLSTRILSEQTRIKSNDIRRGKITEDELERFIETSKTIAELPLYIDETPAIKISTLANRARRIKRLHGIDMIVVDYIQLMKTDNYKYDGRVQEIGEITQGLKALAKELNVPVLALSQLSRAVEQREDKKPQLSDLRESGSIEQDADVVMFVYRPEYYLEKSEPQAGTAEHITWQEKMSQIHNQAQIIIGKQRHGPTGVINVEFDSAYTKFKDATNQKFDN
ncbi:MAG: replicative DNA helicase [Pelagibacterales bacterium]|nr:replicative DNA helicase [Pelagibacterales bacterium]